MVYDWVTSPVDPVAASSGLKMVLQMWLAKTISATHTVVHTKLLCPTPRVHIHVSERFVWTCVTQARVTSWKSSWKPQLLILKLFSLVLTPKHADSSIHRDYLCAYR